MGQGASLSGITSNPAWQLVQPIFDILAVIVLVVMVVWITLKYIRGQHQHIVIQVVFGLIALIFLVDPTIFFGVLNWLIGKLPSGS